MARFKIGQFGRIWFMRVASAGIILLALVLGVLTYVGHREEGREYPSFQNPARLVDAAKPVRSDDFDPPVPGNEATSAR